MIARTVVGLVWGIGTLAVIAALCGVHLNTTASMPIGLWLAQSFDGVLSRGMAVAVCLPTSEQTRRYVGAGSCPNGLEPLLKTVGAVPGDVVTLSAAQISVNDQVVPGSARLPLDGAGRPLTAFPDGIYPVPSGQVWLISTHTPDSYDSRYFGPVAIANVVEIGRPLWTGK